MGIYTKADIKKEDSYLLQVNNGELSRMVLGTFRKTTQSHTKTFRPRGGFCQRKKRAVENFVKWYSKSAFSLLTRDP